MGEAEYWILKLVFVVLAQAQIPSCSLYLPLETTGTTVVTPYDQAYTYSALVLARGRETVCT
jgi:hypothetical protein